MLNLCRNVANVNQTRWIKFGLYICCTDPKYLILQIKFQHSRKIMNKKPHSIQSEYFNCLLADFDIILAQKNMRKKFVTQKRLTLILTCASRELEF